MDFLPGMINGKSGKHPTEMDIARTKIDDALMAQRHHLRGRHRQGRHRILRHALGRMDARVIAGDTGIALTERAQQFILVPGSPNELAGGKRPRVTLSPTIVTEQRQAVPGAFHARRRQPGAKPDPDCSLTW